MSGPKQTEGAALSSAAKRILDVGCGWNKTPGAIGMDANPATHADVIHDLGAVPSPFKDDEFDEVVCRHVAEHVPDVRAFVTELYRITRPGGRITITTPHYSNPDWPTDPTHRNHFNSYSFNLFHRRTPAFSLLHYGKAETDPRLRFPGQPLARLWCGADSELGSALAGAEIHAQVLGVLSELHLSRQGTTIRI